MKKLDLEVGDVFQASAKKNVIFVLDSDYRLVKMLNAPGKEFLVIESVFEGLKLSQLYAEVKAMRLQVSSALDNACMITPVRAIELTKDRKQSSSKPFWCVNVAQLEVVGRMEPKVRFGDFQDAALDWKSIGNFDLERALALFDEASQNHALSQEMGIGGSEVERAKKTYEDAKRNLIFILKEKLA